VERLLPAFASCFLLVCGRTVLGGKAGASVCGSWRVVERSSVVRPVPVRVWWLVCGRTVLGGDVDVSVCVVVGV